MRSPRSLGRWLSWWLAVQTFIGLGLVCSVVYVATSLNFSARQDEELRHKQEVIRHLVDEIVTQDDLASLRHKLDDFFFGHADLRLRLTEGADGIVQIDVEASAAKFRIDCETAPAPSGDSAGSGGEDSFTLVTSGSSREWRMVRSGDTLHVEPVKRWFNGFSLFGSGDHRMQDLPRWRQNSTPNP